MKKVWITALSKELQPRVPALMELLDTYGLATGGHFWDDDLDAQAWDAAREPVADPANNVWLVLGDEASWGKPSVRLGLSLLALAVQRHRGHGYPMVLALPGDALPAAETLPTPLRAAKVVSADDPTLGAKLLAAASKPPARVAPPYRLGVYAMKQLGLWLELGPATGQEPWAGALLGAADAEVDSHGVGPAGELPKTAVLEYPIKGMTLEAGEAQFHAWAVRNAIDVQNSYFARITGDPSAVVFGPLGDSDAPELFVLKLT